MKTDSIRTSIDLPRDLYRRLQQAAAREGCSVRQLILRSIGQLVEETTPRRRRRRLALDPPSVPSRGKPFNLTNKQIDKLIDLP